MQEKNYLTVSELNAYVQQIIQAGFPDAVWVCGEIQGFDRNKTKKHVFFDLCEKNPETKDVLAKIGLVVFFNRKKFLQRTLEENGNPFELKDDIEVKFLCRVDFYPPHGALRLIVEDIDPAYTLGKIAAEKQRLIALLKKQGVLDKNKDLEFPLLPLRIGLITSYDSAAYNDFLSELELSEFGFQVFYRNALMQGKGAEADICKAFSDLFKAADHLDVIVLTRGGGSIADLSCFDSEKIARTIAQSPLPVVSGIGHEINISIADLASYSYQKTPTAVAQFLAAQVEEVLTDIEEKGEHLLALVQDQVREQSERLRQLAFNFQESIRDFLKDHEQMIIRIQEILQRGPLRTAIHARQELERSQERFLAAAESYMIQKHQRLEHCRRCVELSDPKNICRKGFSITRTDQGKLIRSVRDLKKKQALQTHLYDGVVQSVVEDFNQEEGG